MPIQVFMSHTKLDKEYCNRFDIVASRVGLKVFRSEFEKLQSPAWKTIRDEINKSVALFLLVGKELIHAQELSEVSREAKEKWKFTQNWISYEIGVVSQRGMDFWVVCDSVTINFPVPYLNNYEIWGIVPEDEGNLDFWKSVFNVYCERGDFSRQFPGDSFTCPHCGATFNLHSELPEKMEMTCPTCLNRIPSQNG